MKKKFFNRIRFAESIDYFDNEILIKFFSKFYQYDFYINKDSKIFKDNIDFIDIFFEKDYNNDGFYFSDKKECKDLFFEAMKRFQKFDKFKIKRG